MELTSISVISLLMVGFWLVLRACRLELSFVHLIGVALSLNWFGLFLLSQGEGGRFVQPYLVTEAKYAFSRSYPFVVFAAGMYAFALGVVVGRAHFGIFERERVAGTLRSGAGLYNTLATLIPLTVVVLLCGYALFAVGGIPLFAQQANIARFTVVKGLGLFWRLQEFGLPALVVLIGVHAYWVRNSSATYRVGFWLLFFATAIAALLRGHKGGIAWLFVYVGLMALAVATPGTARRRLIFGLVLAGTAAAATAFVIAVRILPFRPSVILQLLALRVTSLAGIGFYDVVTWLTPRNGLQLGSGQVHGLYEFLSVLRVYPSGVHSDLTQELARSLFGSSEFQFPVTITMFGDFYYDFGLLGVVAGGLVFGGLCFWLYRRALVERAPDRKALWILVQVQVCMYANRGALLGIFTNNVLSLLMVLIPYLILAEFWRISGPVRVSSPPIADPFS